MPALGPSRTSKKTASSVAFGGKADIEVEGFYFRF